MEMEPIKTEGKRNPDGTFLNMPGPGRPKGKTLKEYQADKFRTMTDEEKEQWIIDNKISGIDAWRMGEGNPAQGVEHSGEINLPVPLDDVLKNDSIQPDQEPNQES